ncbi:hypothetical protein CBR_g22349 [Chara braunii]|uniref:Protein kinase domain-containing protein n=1 Tax=Chara braunii TaxID=69332 RepID=A0A388JV11_CHABU|nr:hypothetical protein CBR_g22349 [Chara braunii]|eukprot:GBG61552.1 hypothetical protein CBR_g22349 [Chara braunii]
MAELHSRGILMRDLKPANFLVDDYDTAVVADFGLSKLLKESATTTLLRGQVAGTPCYMPPEAWGAGDGRLHQTSDVWSFACSVIDMFTGNPPFDSARSILEIQKRVALDKEKPPVPSGLPAEVTEALKKCFAFDAVQRPSFDQLLPIFERNQMAQGRVNLPVNDRQDSPAASPREVPSPPPSEPSPQGSSDPSAPPQRSSGLVREHARRKFSRTSRARSPVDVEFMADMQRRLPLLLLVVVVFLFVVFLHVCLSCRPWKQPRKRTASTKGTVLQEERPMAGMKACAVLPAAEGGRRPATTEPSRRYDPSMYNHLLSWETPLPPSNEEPEGDELPTFPLARGSTQLLSQTVLVGGSASNERGEYTSLLQQGLGDGDDGGVDLRFGLSSGGAMEASRTVITAAHASARGLQQPRREQTEPSTVRGGASVAGGVAGGVGSSPAARQHVSSAPSGERLTDNWDVRTAAAAPSLRTSGARSSMLNRTTPAPPKGRDEGACRPPAGSGASVENITRGVSNMQALETICFLFSSKSIPTSRRMLWRVQTATNCCGNVSRFLPKSWVRIKKTVSSPKYGWPSSDKIAPMHECLGILRKVDTEDVVLVRYCFSDEPMIFRMEELEVTPAFREGDTVRVKGSVQRPRFGWGDVTRNVIGTVAAIDTEKATIKVDFPGYSSGWVADPSQMERLSRPFRKGDWAKLKPSVLRSRRGDSGLQDINESSLAIVKDVLDGGKVKLDFCFKNTYMVMDQCNAELLDTPPFVLNDQVSVKRSVTSPRYEWGGEDYESVGPVAEIRADGLIKVQFYDRGLLWAADPAELFVVHPARAFRKGDWTQVKRSVSEPKYKWGDVKPESFGVVADIDEDGDLRVDFCFRPKLWVAVPSDMVLYNPPPFKLGDMVRVKPSVQAPRCNWAGETHKSVGLIADIRQDGLLEIRFSSRPSLWKADPADMILARGQTQTQGARDSDSDASVAAELLMQLLGKDRIADMFKGLRVKGNE